MSDDNVLSFADRLARAKAKLPAPPTPPTPPVAPVAPPVTFMMGERSENDKMVDTAVDGVDIITAYNLWAGKGTVDPGGRTEGIKVRCPNPAHPDNNPSAWINTDKQVWTCGSCEMGGDKYDIAAWHFGMPVPGYKEGAEFHKLRRKIAEDRGYIFQPTVTGKSLVLPPATPAVGPDGATHESAPPSPPSPEDDHTDADDGATVTVLPTGPIGKLDVEHEIELKWRSIVPKGTFLDIWMRQTIVDDVPEEYHFWNGMLAIASACGRDATLMDSRPVYANLFICFLGRTGSGKSKASYLLGQLLEKALPYKHDDPFSKGILHIKAPASAEALIWTFEKKLEDPSRPKSSDVFPVKGMIDFNELSSLIGRANRAGSVLVPTLMQFYDMETTVETVSRTHGHVRAVQPFASATTTSQPKSLRGLLSMSDAASGFLNRWFFAVGKSKKRVAVGGAQVDVLPAVKPLSDILGWAGKVGSLNWSQEALDLFTNFFHTELEPVMRGDETDLLNRLDLLCKKLILLFAANMKHTRVEADAVEQMMKVYPYILECYGVPGATIGSSLQQEIRENLLRVVVEHQQATGKGASNRDITRRFQSKNYPLDLRNKTLKYMLEIEEIVQVAPEAGVRGRPTIRYAVPDLEDAKDFLKHLALKPKEKKEATK